MDSDAARRVERVPHGGVADVELLDFSANTNPRTPDGVAHVYDAALAESRAYPADDYLEYRGAAADYLNCTPGQVVPTPGGLAGIRLVLETQVGPGDTVLVPYPSFGEYAREVRLQGAEPVFVPHDELLDADLADHAMAVVCNPNNPTGDAYDPDALRGFVARCRDAGTKLLADEAFLGFTDHPTLAPREGVFVARSLTKLFGLPGLRAGFVVATGEDWDVLETARRAWTLGTPAAVVGAYCMHRREFVAETRSRVARERRRMADVLVSKFDVYPSDAPFLLLDVGERDPGAVVSAVRTAGIAIRNATTFRGLDSHVRVAVRLPEQNDRLLEALSRV